MMTVHALVRIPTEGALSSCQTFANRPTLEPKHLIPLFQLSWRHRQNCQTISQELPIPSTCLELSEITQRTPSLHYPHKSSIVLLTWLLQIRSLRPKGVVIRIIYMYYVMIVIPYVSLVLRAWLSIRQWNYNDLLKITCILATGWYHFQKTREWHQQATGPEVPLPFSVLRSP